MEPLARVLSVHEATLIWPQAEEYLREAMLERDDERAIQNIKAKVFAGINTLWEVKKEGEILAYAVSVLYTPDGFTRIAQIHIATARDKDLFVAQMPAFEAWALKHGVHYLEVVGRRGWEKILKPQGFKLDHISLIKRVAQELH